MRKLILAVLIAGAVVASGCDKNITDYQVHHYVTRVKADTVVDQRNAWCTFTISPAPAIGTDLSDEFCIWTNPSATVHP